MNELPTYNISCLDCGKDYSQELLQSEIRVVPHEIYKDKSYHFTRCGYCHGNNAKIVGTVVHWFAPNSIVVNRITDQQGKYFTDIIQPYRSGEASREYIEAYPEQAAKTFTDDEIAKSKYVWKDLKHYDEKKIKKPAKFIKSKKQR